VAEGGGHGTVASPLRTLVNMWLASYRKHSICCWRWRSINPQRNRVNSTVGFSRCRPCLLDQFISSGWAGGWKQSFKSYTCVGLSNNFTANHSQGFLKAKNGKEAILTCRTVFRGFHLQFLDDLQEKFWSERWLLQTHAKSQMCFGFLVDFKSSFLLNHSTAARHEWGDVTRHHHRCVSSWVMWLRMLRATTSLPKQPFAFFFFYNAFLLSDQ